MVHSRDNLHSKFQVIRTNGFRVIAVGIWDKKNQYFFTRSVVSWDIQATQSHVGGWNGCVVELAKSTRGHLSNEVMKGTP